MMMKRIENKTTILFILDNNLKTNLEKEAQLMGLTTSAYIRLILNKRKNILN